MPTSIDVISKNCANRDKELEEYQANIDTYSTALTALPAGWPAELEQYKTRKVETLIGTLPDATVTQIAELQYRDRLTFLLMTEKIEKRKVEIIKEALVAQGTHHPDFGTKVAAEKEKLDNPQAL